MKYRIESGWNHFKNSPLFRVVWVDNEYVGEWCSSLKAAQNEMRLIC